MVPLLIGLLVLAAISWWAGFRAEPHPWQPLSKAGFVVQLLLASFVASIVVWEVRSARALAALVTPLPEVTDVDRVGLPEAVTAAGASQREGTSAELAEGLAYWRVETELLPSEVSAFYGDPANAGRWNVTLNQPPWIQMRLGEERLLLFIQEVAEGSRVWYSYERGPTER